MIFAAITITSQREEAIDFTYQYWHEMAGAAFKVGDEGWFYLLKPLQVGGGWPYLLKPLQVGGGWCYLLKLLHVGGGLWVALST